MRVLIEFDDVEGLLAYLAHPQHAAIGMHFVQSAAAALAYDYEMKSEWTIRRAGWRSSPSPAGKERLDHVA